MACVVDTGVMRLLLVVLLVSCTRQNPNLCCTDEADCAAAKLPVRTDCDDGKVCRGNVCIEQSCTASSECDLAAPYCVGDSCQVTCSDDVECPGFGQAAQVRFCSAGSCVECRTGSDCAEIEPVCSPTGACTGCTDHAQCPSGICTLDGSCGLESAIAYVDLVGSPTTDCTKAAPCSTLEHALGLQPARQYILLSTGRYARTGPLTIMDSRWIVGGGTPRPTLDRDDDGPIILAQGSVKLTLEGLELSGATGPVTNGILMTGSGIYCRPGGGAPSLVLRDVLVRNNAYAGIQSLNCTFSILRSAFTQNQTGVFLQDSNATIDASTFSNNETGANLDSGLFVFTNNMVTRNTYAGLQLYSVTTGNKVEFNSIVDNALAGSFGAGFDCNLMTPTTFPNNIIARNRTATIGTNCTYPGSIIVDADLAPLKFKQPDTAPYDYHLTAGSIAIDMATVSTMDHDFDGDTRPMGAGRDVGADEAR